MVKVRIRVRAERKQEKKYAVLYIYRTACTSRNYLRESLGG